VGFRRGQGSVNVELANLQGWCERTSEILEGVNGQPGLIKEHEDMMMRDITAKQLDEQSAKKWARFSTFLVAIPVLINIFSHFHWFGF
jgi:hypothetical protein